MKKRLLAILLTVMMLIGMATTANAYTTQQYYTAEALNHLELFLGRTVGEKDYDLDATLTREEGVTLLVRMLGKVDTAIEGGDFDMPFQDVKGTWGVISYVGYAWKNGYVKGTGKPGDVEFNPKGILEHYLYLTIVLRVMGYKDSGENPQFTWNAPHTLAYNIGLIDSIIPDEDLTRGEAIEIFWRMLGTKIYGTDKTLATRLIEQGVFTSAEYSEARQIHQYGAIIYPVTPSDPEDPVDPIDPEDPADPVDPEDPAGPVDPADPVDPVDPVDPIDPVDPVDPVDPADPVDPEDPVDPVDPEDPVDPVDPVDPAGPIDPEDPEDSVNPVDPGADGKITYEEYQAMTGEEQMEFFESFEDPMEFFDWLEKAKAEYEAQNPSIEVGGDGNVDLGDLTDGN